MAMTVQERRAGLILVVLGVLTAYYGLSVLKIGTVGQPGPGFFPFLSGAGIAVLCLLWILSNRAAASAEPLWGQGQLTRPALATAITTAYAVLMEPLGYIVATLAFLISWQLVIEREHWRKTAVIAVLGTAGMYLLFMYLLGVALPGGIFE
jgi:putative tricarboxylic transport membrane protein